MVVAVAELGVTVGVLAAFDRLRVALQAESRRAQQVGHRPRRDPVSLPAQFAG